MIALRDISSACEKANIQWSLFGGSALGAVRHQGFIPWDDDIDLYMTRSNFNKFKDIFESELSTKYELKLPGDPGYLMHYPQIYIKDTVAQLIQSTGKTIDRLFIDVFIMEATFDNGMLRMLHGSLCTALLLVDSCVRTKCCSENLSKCDDGSGRMLREIHKRACIAKLFSFQSLEYWLKLSDKVFGMKKTGVCVCCLPKWRIAFL